MAAGIGKPWSDYDVRLIVQDDASASVVQYYADAVFPLVDLSVLTLSDFAAYAAWGSPEAWDRPTFTHARVLLDRSGFIQALVADKGRLPPDRQEGFVASMLDAFINSVYRTLKCQRRDDTLCVRLEASEAVTYALHLLFAWEGRLKPYPAWLTYDLDAAPLTTLPVSSETLLRLLTDIMTDGDTAALQELFAMILGLAHERGHRDIIASWGEDIVWMRSFAQSSSGGERSIP